MTLAESPDASTVKQRQRRTLLTCGGAHALHDGLVDMLYVLLPVLAQSFGLNYTQVGLIRAANKAAMALFQIPAGLMAERLGERNLLAFGTLCTGLAFIALGTPLGASSGFYPILVLLFIAGFGAAFQHPLCSALVSNAYPGHRRRGALGTYNFTGDVGKFTFAGGVSLALAAGLSWEAPVMIAGALGVVIAVVIILALPALAQPTLTSSPSPDASSDNAPLRTVAKPGWGIRDRTGFSALCAIAVIDSSTRSGFLTFVAFLMIEKGVSSGLATVAIPVIFVGGMVGKLACGFLADRIGVIRTVVLTELATGGGILLALVLPNLAAYALLPLIGVALNGTSSVLYGTIGDLVDSDRQSRAFGLFYTLGSTCGILAPLGYGLMGDWIGITTTLAVVGMVVFLTIPLCLVLRPAIAAHSAA